MDKATHSHLIKGYIITICGGLGWAMGGACGQILFRDCGVDAVWLVPIRMFLAGLMVLAIAMGVSSFFPYSTRPESASRSTAACAYRCKSSCSCPASFSSVSSKRCVACSRIPSLTYPCRQNPPILSRHRIPAKRAQKKPRIIITPKRVPYYYDYYEADSLSYSIICLM